MEVWTHFHPPRVTELLDAIHGAGEIAFWEHTMCPDLIDIQELVQVRELRIRPEEFLQPDGGLTAVASPHAPFPGV